MRVVITGGGPGGHTSAGLAVAAAPPARRGGRSWGRSRGRLAGARVLFFNYPKAAETFDTISRNPHFQPKDQRESAKQALSLYSSLGDGAGMNRAKERFFSLGASPKEKAEADFIVASADLKKWDEFSPDTGANSAARQRAETSMKNYYEANKNNDQAAQYVVRAAYYVAKSKRASKSRMSPGGISANGKSTMEAPTTITSRHTIGGDVTP